jgi:hypothetical protein
MKFLRIIYRKTGKDTIKSKIYKDVGIKNMLTVLEDKRLQWFGFM